MKTPKYRHLGTGMAVVLASMIMLSPMMNANAAGVRLDTIPTLRIEEGWYSNVNNTETDKISSLGTRLSPGLALKFTSPDNVMLQVSGNYEKVWYSASDAKDADYNTWFFRVDSTGGWALTPTSSLRPSVYYVNTTSSDRRTQLVPSGDPLVPPVSITNYGNTKSQNFGGALEFEYLVSPNIAIGISGNYSEQRFPGDNIVFSSLTNSTQAGGGFSVSYLVSPRTKMGVVFSGSHQSYEGSPNSNTYSAGLLYGYQFSPALRLDATLGATHLRQESGPGTPGENKTSPSGQFNLVYASGTFNTNLYGSAVYNGGSGFGQATRQLTAGLIVTDQIAMDWSWNLSGAYQVSKSAFSSDAVNITTMYGAAGLRYQAWEWAGFDLSGNVNHQTSDGLVGTSLNSYSTVLGFTIGKPYNIF